MEIGIPDRFSGPGVRDAGGWEIEDAIGPNTAGIYYLAQSQSLPALPVVTELARRHGIPVLVDAAAQLPPAGNLRAYLAQGADLVAFSGGKAIGGPQSSGILCGRADLVSSALMQMLDLDVREEAWKPPPEFASLSQMRGLPHHGIGRSCKAGKEEIVGLMAALEMFVAEPTEVRRARWTTLLRAAMDACGATDELDVRLLDADRYPVPLLRVEPRGGPRAAAALEAALRAGTPSIQCQTGQITDGVLLFSPVALAPDQAAVIGRRLRDAAPHLADDAAG